MFLNLLDFNKKFILNLFLVLIALYPLFTIVGPLFENINIFFLGLISILFFLQNKKLIKLKDLSIVFFFIIIFIYGLNSNNSIDALKSLKYIFYLFILLFCLKVKFQKDNLKSFDRTIYFICFIILVLSIDMIVQKNIGFNLLGYKSLSCYFDSIIIKNCRVSSFFGNEYVAGSFISRIILILSLYYALIKKRYLIIIPILILGFIAVYYSGERMAFGFFLQIFLITVIYILIAERKKLNFLKLFLAFFIILISSLFAFNQNTLIRYSKGIDLLYKYDNFRIDVSEDQIRNIDKLKFDEKYIDKEFKLIPNEVYGFYIAKDGKIKKLTPRYINNLSFVPSFLDSTNFKIDMKKLEIDKSVVQIISTNKVHKHFFNSTGWSAHFIAAIKIFQKNIFFGTGFKSFNNECNKLGKIPHIYDIHKCSFHPHNFHLELLQSTGLIGYICFMILVYYLFMTLFKINNLSKLDKLFIICLLLVLFQPITTSGSFFSSSFTNKLWLVSSIIILLSRLKGFKNESNH